MPKISINHIMHIDNLSSLCIHAKSGIAFIMNGKTGETFICHHPSIDSSGSVSGMKRNGNWNKNDLVVRNVYGCNVNISKICISSLYDIIASIKCRCSECMQHVYSTNQKHFLRKIFYNKESFNICPKCMSVKCITTNHQLSAIDGYKLSDDELTAFAILLADKKDKDDSLSFFGTNKTCINCLEKEKHVYSSIKNDAMSSLNVSIKESDNGKNVTVSFDTGKDINNDVINEFILSLLS